MREKQIQKINKKNLKQKYSSIELDDLAEEVKEYNTLLHSIGLQIDKNDVKKIKVPKLNKKQSKKTRKEKKLKNAIDKD